ncbi:uncharacterized protein LOC116212163 [Punica granatum]|uniref:Uncharacterized protein LOC116212163 n=1 Tax=Punica granatum TaxID=22663 RepID=A0A6P8E7V1_PUNGR|nr:uncharacterized protein LOC116212163 [Punica granatum]
MTVVFSRACGCPPKFKISEFKTYEGTTDPRHHLRHYRGKMLQYWGYEEFVIHSFQDSLSGTALDWFMSLKAEDIPTWADLSRKFIDQYQYCAEAPPTLLELSTKEMARGQMFEEYIRPISPGSNFDPSIQDQFKRCEYHQGGPGHTLDNCWRLRDEIQKRIDSNRLTFNAVKPPNVQDNPLPDHRPSSGPSINMISICASGRDEDARDNPLPFVIDYTPEEPTVGLAGRMASPAPFVVDIPAREPYADSKVPWTYEGSVGSVEQQFSVMGMTRSGRVYENPAAKDKGKAPATEVRAVPESSPFPSKRVTKEEAEAFMKIIKALLRVLTAAQIPKEMPPDRIEETVGSIFSNTISFSDDELPSEGWSHSWALHIVCKCNNYIIGRVMIDNGSALNICPVTTLKQMNVDLNRVRLSKTAVRAFDGSRREEKLITVKGEEDYAIYKETAVPYISIGDDENLPFHSFETISVIRDYGEIGPSRTDRMIGKVLLRNNYVPGTGLGARGLRDQPPNQN